MGIMNVNKDEPIEHKIHEMTKVGKDGARPRARLSCELMEKLNTPLIDETRGEVVDITFKDGTTNTIFFATEQSRCPLLQELYMLVKKYRESMHYLKENIPQKLWIKDCLAGGLYLPGGLSLRGGTQGCSAKLPFLRKECSYNSVRELFSIYAKVVGLQSLIMRKYCPCSYHANHELYQGGEDCIFPSPRAQSREQQNQAGSHWCLNQVAVRVMANNKCLGEGDEMMLSRCAAHVDLSDVNSEQLLSFVSLEGKVCACVF